MYLFVVVFVSPFSCSAWLCSCFKSFVSVFFCVSLCGCVAYLFGLSGGFVSSCGPSQSFCIPVSMCFALQLICVCL